MKYAVMGMSRVSSGILTVGPWRGSVDNCYPCKFRDHLYKVIPRAEQGCALKPAVMSVVRALVLSCGTLKCGGIFELSDN